MPGGVVMYVNANETWAGEVARSRSRRTKTTIVLLDLDNGGDWAGTSDDGGRWMTVCDDHGTLCQHDVKATARAFMATPDEWCELCAEALDAKAE